jgi:predicted ATP-dependent endonuclease of OLD family
LSIRNFKSYKDTVSINNLNRINVFIGPNGAGKSNIIHAIYLLNQLLRGDYTSNIVQEYTFDHKNDNKISLHFEFELTSQERKQILDRFLTVNDKLDISDKNFLTKLRYIIELQGQVIVEERLSIFNTSDFTDIIIHKIENGIPNQYILNLGSLLKRVQNVALLEKEELVKNASKWSQSLSILQSQNNTFDYDIADMVKSFIRNFHYYLPGRNIDHRITKGEETFIVGDGRNIKRLIKTLHEKDFSKFYELHNSVNEILGFEKMRFDDSNNIVGINVSMEGLESEFDLSTLSHGHQQLIILLGALHILKSENIYLIEEPEVHLHSASQKRLLLLLIENSDDKQFFITTHSPIFVTQDKRMNTYLVTKNKGESKITLLENEEQVEFLKGQMGIDRADALASKFVIFVEGASEITALRKIGEVSSYSRLRFSIPILPYGSQSKFDLLTEFTTYIHKLDLIPIIIADGHPDIMTKIKDLERTKELHKIVREKDQQLEDQFDSPMIVKAMNILYKDPFKISISANELESRRAEKNVATILNNHLLTNYGIELDKTKLAEVLTSLIIDEIKKNPERNKQKFEIEVDAVLSYIDSRS